MIRRNPVALPIPRLTLISLTTLFAVCCSAHAQQGFFDRWQARASATQALQPKWSVPVVSPYPMLIQVFRSDFTRQISTAHVHTWSLDASRGLNFIPFARTEVDIFTPPFLEHSDTTPNGFGDFSMSAKFRILSANEQHGNYLLSAFIIATVPSGSYKNGATDASVNPTISGGKGFGRFDIITNLGGTLPRGGTVISGRTITTNTAAQYHMGRYLWPELELNSTPWYGGTRDGKTQAFLTPGIMTSKFALHSQEANSRKGIAAGFGFQTAVTTYHSYNHSLTFTGRFLF
ncbi:MAG: hypothetical protein ABI286_10650 [Edaphobacter sp.]